jgi:hypothetical protein
VVWSACGLHRFLLMAAVCGLQFLANLRVAFPIMVRKRKSAPPTSKDQLSLFDFGLDGSNRQVVPAPERAPDNVEPVEIMLPPSSSGLEHVRQVSLRELQPRPPTPFEEANYAHYLRLRVDTYNLAKLSGILAVLLIAVALLGVKVLDAGFGPVRLTFFRHSHLVGLLGWLTILSSGWTLLRTVHMRRKQRDCGMFYQRVLQFSATPVMVLVSRCFGFMFVIVFLAIIALTWILARTEMLYLAEYVLKGILSLFDPWAPTVTPTWMR